MRFHFDQFALDTERFELSANGMPIRAEPQVIELLIFLVQNQGRLVTRDELIRTIWKGRIVSDSAISGRIKMARKALGDNGRQQKYIRTIHKKGFCFTAKGEIEDITGSSSDADGRDDWHPRELAPPGARRRTAKPSIGILKFTSPGGAPEQRVFADGITEDLITTLSKISRLTVVAHPDIPGAEMNVVNARQAGEQLNVHNVLFGSVRSDGDRLRISVHLVDTQSGHYVWTQRYEGSNRKLFELQDEITKEAVSALQVELTEGEQALLLSRGTADIEAWQLTFQGQAAVLEHHQDSVRRGMRQLERAIELDENYALAWSSLAVAHWKESVNIGWSESREVSLRLATEASDRAMALEPDNAGILAMRSLILISRREFDAALELAHRALHLAGSESSTIALAAITLRYCCKPQQAIAYTRKAMQLCPVYPSWYPYGIAICYWMMNDLEAAAEYLEEALEIDPKMSLSYVVQVMIHAETGDLQKARAAVAAILEIDPKFSSQAFMQGLPFSDPQVEARRKRALTKAGMP